MLVRTRDEQAGAARALSQVSCLSLSLSLSFQEPLLLSHDREHPFPFPLPRSKLPRYKDPRACPSTNTVHC